MTDPATNLEGEAPAWNHVELFDHWVASRDKSGPKGREYLSPQVGELYRMVWDKWVRWLTEERRDAKGTALRPRRNYLNATAHDIDTFLRSAIEPSTDRVDTEGRHREFSPITAARYGGLLQMVYEHAKNQRMLAENPARGRTVGTVKKLRQKGMDPAGEGEVISRNHWNAVKAAAPPADSEDPMMVRDRAILLLLMDAHLTSSEICALDVENIGFAPEDRRKQHQRHLSVEIAQGRRKAQERVLQLELTTSNAVDRWLEARKELSVAPKKAALFVTDRKDRNRLSKRVLFHLVARVMRQVHEESGYPLPYHVGPQVLRNSAIVFRLNKGDSKADVARDAGMKDARSFRGLQAHLEPPKA